MVAAAIALPRPGAAAPPPGAAAHLGAGSCAAAACHGGTEPKKNEHTIWRQKDRHARAWESLLSERGRRMGRRLGLDDAAKAPECLSCHGTDPARETLGPRFDERDGVSCELCHGGASTWLGPHASPGWDASKRAEFGMRDLSTPAARAAVCVECHRGGPGRQVDHRMYAAGHPPLTFDAAAFMEKMPPHWRDDADLSRATWIEGLRSSARAEAERAASGSRDFAAFDCQSCHHPVGAESPYSRHESAAPLGEPAPDLACAIALAAVLGLEPPRDAAGAVRVVAAPGEGTAEALDRHLALVAEDRVRTPPRAMEQLAYAARALSPRRGAPEFGADWEKLCAALAPSAPYDPAVCARLARSLLRSR